MVRQTLKILQRMLQVFKVCLTILSHCEVRVKNMFHKISKLRFLSQLRQIGFISKIHHQSNNLLLFVKVRYSEHPEIFN